MPVYLLFHIFLLDYLSDKRDDCKLSLDLADCFSVWLYLRVSDPTLQFFQYRIGNPSDTFENYKTDKGNKKINTFEMLPKGADFAKFANSKKALGKAPSSFFQYVPGEQVSGT